MARLYKFVSDTSAVDSLLSGEIKFSPISELNDPAELVPSVNRQAVMESLTQLRASGYTEADMAHLRQQQNLMQILAPRYQAIEVPATTSEASRLLESPIYSNLDFLEQQLLATANEMSSKVGLFCVSKRFDSLPMWAHYAANATGIAVEFNDLESFFQGDGTGILRQPTAVSYQGDSPGITFDPESHKSLFFSKFPDWSYEQEVRVVLPLSECKKKSFSGRPIYTYQIPKRHVTRLIIGWRMKVENASALEAKVMRSYPDIAISRAHIARGRVVVG